MFCVVCCVLGELVEYLRVGLDQCLANTVEILCSRLVLVLQFCFYVQHTNEDIGFCGTFIDRYGNLAILTTGELLLKL